MSGEEFALWRSYDWISPLGGERADRHAALISSLIFNANRAANTEPLGVDDFNLFRDPPRQLSRAEEEEAFRLQFVERGFTVVNKVA
jgi:hypothetical protein